MKRVLFAYSSLVRKDTTQAGVYEGAKVSSVFCETIQEVFAIFTSPEIDENFTRRDYSTTTIWRANECRKGIFSRQIIVDDQNRKIFTIARESLAEAQSIHQQVAKIISRHHPDSWLALFPAPLPPSQSPDMRKLIHARHAENLVEARRIHEEVKDSPIPRASLFASPENPNPKPLTDEELAALAEIDFKKRQSERR